METTPITASAMAERIEQLGKLLVKANTPDDQNTQVKFRVNHESVVGTVCSLRGPNLNLLPLLRLSEMGLTVESLDTYRSGLDSVAVILVSPQHERLVNHRIIETKQGSLLAYRDFNDEEDLLCLLIWDEAGNRIQTTMGFTSPQAVQQSIVDLKPQAVEELMRPYLALTA